VDVHINVTHGPQLHSESQLRINQAMHMLSLASNTLDRLEVCCCMSALLNHFFDDYCYVLDIALFVVFMLS